MHTTYHLGISFPHDIILSLLLILAFLNSVSALVTLRVSLRGCFEARVAGKRTTVKCSRSFLEILVLLWHARASRNTGKGFLAPLQLKLCELKDPQRSVSR